MRSRVPNLALVDITCGLLLEESPNLLKLASAGAGIVQQIAQLARIWLHVLNVLLKSRVTF